MPEAVRLVASDEEWGEFQSWQASPKPIMLTLDGKFPDVPHDLADELFGRLISMIKSGQKASFGSREDQFDLVEIPAFVWSTHWYNIWFNVLVDTGRGAVAFSSICVGEPVQPVEVKPPQLLRSAMKAELDAWVYDNPGVQVRKKDLREAIIRQLEKKHPGNSFSKTMFNELWRQVPRANKFSSNPAWVGGKGAEKT